MAANGQTSANPRMTTVIGGRTGAMSVVSHTTIIGPPIARVDRVDTIAGLAADPPLDAAWILRGVATKRPVHHPG